jgi:hypothetical protein
MAAPMDYNGGMVIDLIKIALCVPLVVCAAMTFYCVFTAFRCLAVIVGKRKEGVPWLRALAYHNMMFRPSLYEPDAAAWWDRYIRCLIGVWVFIFATGGIGLLIKWLSGLGD